MRLNRTIILALTVSLAASGRAYAKNDDKDDDDAGASSGDLSDQATKLIDDMKSGLEAVGKLVEQARSDRDPLKLNCVNEKKTQINSLIKVAELSLEDLRSDMKE